MNKEFVEKLMRQQEELGNFPPKSGKKIVVALSGGVDSSVVAALLKYANHPVEAIFMKNWEEDDTDSYCAAQEDLNDAQSVCCHLDIPLHSVNFSSQYWEEVFERFLFELKHFRTPNPDVLCNKWVKFDSCLMYARQVLGADFLATGHYARILRKNNQSYLLKGLDSKKDQSYFLHALSVDQLAYSLFPLGGLTKDVVRKLAEFFKLPTARKKDSTGLCFISPKKFSTFISRYLSSQPGLIEDGEGRIVGEHLGLSYYTIGQRKGLKLSQIAEKSGKAWYVLKKDIENNRLIVTDNKDDPRLLTQMFSAMNVHWINFPDKKLSSPNDKIECSVKVRYRQEDVGCIVEKMGDDSLSVKLKTFVRACTPGQYAVFYHGDCVLGGAAIQ